MPDELTREALEADPETQIVILGACLDTSGLRIGAERRACGKAPGLFFEVESGVVHYLTDVAEARRALELNPVSLVTNLNAGWIYWRLEQNDRIVDHGRSPGYAALPACGFQSIGD